MVGQLIIRGLIVGIVAGLIAFGWAKIFGEPATDAAIAYESAQSVAAGAPEEPEIVTRGVQTTFGLLTGMVVVGVGLGALFSILFAFGYGRIGNLAPQPTSVLLAVASFVTIYLIPALKYPPGPPASSDAETIKFRTATYLLLMALSVATTIASWGLRQRLVAMYGNWYASILGLAAYVVVIGAIYLILPNINEVPADFPAVTLYNFRLASLGIQFVLWAAIGLMFGAVVERTVPGFQSASVASRGQLAGTR